MNDRPAARPHMWRMYVQTLLPDATREAHVVSAPHPVRRRIRDRRQRIDRVRRLHRLGIRAL
jgi:hypothetical protein